MSYELNIKIKCLTPLLLGDVKNFLIPPRRYVCRGRVSHTPIHFVTRLIVLNDDRPMFSLTVLLTNTQTIEIQITVNIRRIVDMKDNSKRRQNTWKCM